MTLHTRHCDNHIIGLGVTGMAVARFLARRDATFVVYDSRAEPPLAAQFARDFPHAELHCGPFATTTFAHAKRLIVSPGVALREPAIQHALALGIPALGDIELFAQTARAPVVAITGANGKSTVTTLVGDMARDAGVEVRVGGNLGTPALDLLGDTEPQLYVLELSSFQLETTHTLAPRAAVVLNISADHMDRYVDVAEYSAAKARIYARAQTRIANADDALVMAMVKDDPSCITFTLHAPRVGHYGVIEADGARWLARGTQRLINERELKIAGRHNTANALAALALGHAVGLRDDTMCATLRKFGGLPHRTQWVAERDGVTWFNDSKGTNVGATVAALQGMPGKVVLIAGGDGKGQDFAELRPALQQYGRGVVLIGRDAPLIARAVGDAVPTRNAHDMREAVQLAQQLAKRGDVVLLSPACASFDMYKGYTHRGDVFVEAVRSLLT
ncbi:MAG: UDP-N-acetylmuramoyl-L-alanine--D-glutamate ligase [Gammaproteobacteria bacterium]|nr:UDP-N-acetylmuramoyl-L-alanine--D-glutamate ligase [Gammaproteobacteria bacterium]